MSYESMQGKKVTIANYDIELLMETLKDYIGIKQQEQIELQSDSENYSDIDDSRLWTDMHIAEDLLKKVKEQCE